MKKYAYTIGLSTAALLGATIVHAEPRPLNKDRSPSCHRMEESGLTASAPMHRMNPSHFIPNLTEDQRSAIEGLWLQEAEQTIKLRQQERQSMTSLAELSSSQNYSEAAAKALADQLGSVRANILVTHSRFEHQVHELLTPEQKAYLAERHKRPDHASHVPTIGG